MAGLGFDNSRKHIVHRIWKQQHRERGIEWFGEQRAIAVVYFFWGSFHIFFILLCMYIGKTWNQWSDMANPSSLANANDDDDRDVDVDVDVNIDADVDHRHSKGAMEMASMNSKYNNTSQQDKLKTNSSGSSKFRDDYYNIKDRDAHEDTGDHSDKKALSRPHSGQTYCEHSWQCRAKAFTISYKYPARFKRKNDGGMSFDVSFLCFVAP
ncbi:hypothetical protein RFI_02928 [Reticulomyxa filosa]|uniref:Uncharacterized protein n=1 Tax=Reticulomyxa filosa TaxID=46433 RepID=X6P6K3_RETFI|nr:hypothetical protein RFI_02928 [Reticulomyxa filosa]|eukprot:ETO34165.1 hypothetical protein RFI_02928 [Reticulomyxa filosa]